MYLKYFVVDIIQTRVVIPLSCHLLLVKALLCVPLAMVAIVYMPKRKTFNAMTWRSTPSDST